MKLFVIFVTIFIFETCAESNIDNLSDDDESGENIFNLLTKSSWTKACVYANGKWKCQEFINNGDGQPTKTKTYSGKGLLDNSLFKDLFGNLQFEMLGDRSSLIGNNRKRSKRASNVQNSQNSQSTQSTQSIQSTQSTQSAQSAQNPQRTQSIPNTPQTNGKARIPFKIVRQNSKTRPDPDDDILI